MNELQDELPGDTWTCIGEVIIIFVRQQPVMMQHDSTLSSFFLCMYKFSDWRLNLSGMSLGYYDLSHNYASEL